MKINIPNDAYEDLKQLCEKYGKIEIYFNLMDMKGAGSAVGHRLDYLERQVKEECKYLTVEWRARNGEVIGGLNYNVSIEKPDKEICINETYAMIHWAIKDLNKKGLRC